MAKPADRRRIIFLFSDTGGGHRSAAEAIIEALHLEFPDQFEAEMIDIFRNYAPPPLDMAPEFYSDISRVPRVWRLGYHFSDNFERTRLIYDAIWPYMRVYVRRLVRENPCDLLVSVHPVINHILSRYVQKMDLPFITVVTDMVSAHVAWFDRLVEKTIVSTELARQRALALGLSSEQVTLVNGLPVAERFCQPGEAREVLRARLGWPQDQPVILLVGGGEGMGPLEAVARTIDREALPASLVIVCGRNKKLKEHLEKHFWRSPTFIYGFVNEMPDFMRAADILVSKAGPGTICEAFISNLPIVLYSRMPGQEDGNVSYVVNEGAGVWAPRPEAVAATLRRWLDHPEERLQVAAASKRLAHPDAARQIARILAQRVGVNGS